MIWSFLKKSSLGQHKLDTNVLLVQTKFLILSVKELAIHSAAAVFLSLIALAAAVAEETNPLTCPQKHLAGEAAQEMMVKGVIMHTQLESKANEVYTEYTFVHTVRADWTIWICVQAVDARNGKPDNLRLSCTACDY